MRRIAALNSDRVNARIEKRGLVLVVVLVAIVLGAAYAGELIRTARLSNARQRAAALRLQADLLARAGILRASTDGTENWSYSTSIDEANGLVGTVTVTRNERNPEILRSVAVIWERGQRRVQVSRVDRMYSSVAVLRKQ